MMEIEAKLRLRNPTKVQSRLKSLDAEFEGLWLEKNWLFDHRERILARQDKLLRVRESGRVYLTYKGPRLQTTYKEREEIEIEFPNAAAGRALLESMGFVRWFYYEKMRETWRLGSCEIVLDELPALGTFIEIEGPGVEEIEETIKKLKLSRRDRVESTYVELFDEYTKSNNGEQNEFVFSPDHKYSLGPK